MLKARHTYINKLTAVAGHTCDVTTLCTHWALYPHTRRSHMARLSKEPSLAGRTPSRTPPPSHRLLTMHSNPDSEPHVRMSYAAGATQIWGISSGPPSARKGRAIARARPMARARARARVRVRVRIRVRARVQVRIRVRVQSGFELGSS